MSSSSVVLPANKAEAPVQIDVIGHVWNLRRTGWRPSCRPMCISSLSAHIIDFRIRDFWTQLRANSLNFTPDCTSLFVNLHYFFRLCFYYYWAILICLMYRIRGMLVALVALCHLFEIKLVFRWFILCVVLIVCDWDVKGHLNDEFRSHHSSIYVVVQALHFRCTARLTNISVASPYFILSRVNASIQL